MASDLISPKQAIEVLNQATRAVQATRDQHQLIIQALEVLKKLVDDAGREN